jgi:pimeloyl-ACP methyl ester carboxylesterase
MVCLLYGKSVSRNFRYMDPVFLDALASKFNVITFVYSGIGLSRGPRAADTLSIAKDVKEVAEAFKLTKIIVA